MFAAAVLVNFTWSVITILLVYLLGRYLFGECVARVAVILLICWPWSVWLGIAAQGDSMYQCGFVALTYAMVRWQREGALRWLLLSAAICFLLTMTRYQGWIVAILVVSLLAATPLIRPVPRRYWRILVPLVALILLFPISWLGYHAIVFGDPMHWKPNTELGSWNRLNLSRVVRGGRFLAWVALTSPLFAPFMLLGIGKLRRLAKPEMVTYSLFSYGYFFALIAYGAVSVNVARYLEQRYVVPTILVCLPLVAAVLVEIRIWWRARVVLIACICIWSVVSCFRVTRQFQDEANIAE
ncbi:MAG: glycosyltransferase family 39 protein, partial [Planctomycetota bacterium]